MPAAHCPAIELSAHGVLAAWARGMDVHPLARPAEVVAVAWPELGAQGDDLPVGACDTVMLAVHVGTFHARAAAVASCPSCEQDVELDIDAAAILASLPLPGDVGRERTDVVADGRTARVRVPTLGDMRAVADAAGTSAEARRLLVERCVELGGERSPTDDLSDDLVAAAADRIAAADPAADIALRLACPQCGTAWTTPWAIGSFVWSEIEAAARGLLLEVDELASRYGWREADILAMTSGRRRAYLDLR